MFVALDKAALKPTRAHSTDAGLDIRSPIEAVVRANGSLTIRTGVHVELPSGTAGLLVSKSGLLVHHVQP